MREPRSGRAASFAVLQLIAAGMFSPISPVAADEHALSVDDGDQAGARDAYSAGLSAYARGAYTEAVREFTRADSLSASPNAKLMLGRCLRQLDQLPDAYRALTEIVESSDAADPRYANTRKAAEEELRIVRNQIGILTVYVRAEPDVALLHVNGQRVPASDWHSALPVRPGIVRLTLETAPGVIERRELELSAGQRSSVVIGTPDAVTTAPPEVAPAEEPEVVEPEQAPRGSPGLRIAGYVAGGTSALSFVAFGVMGALSSANFAKLEARCPDHNQCDPSLEALAERGRTQQTLANVALGVGIATLATGVVLFVWGSPPEHEGIGARTTASVAVTPVGVSVRGAL